VIPISRRQFKSRQAYLLIALLGLAIFGGNRLASAQESGTLPEQSATASHASAGSVPAHDDEKEVDEADAYRHSAMVKKIGGMMGMSTEKAADVFEWGNFLLLAGAVLWALVKMLPGVFRDRGSAIQKELVEARTATEQAGARLNSVEARLAKLDGEIAALRAQAEQDSARDEARIKASVEDEKKNILAAAEQEIAAATMHAQKSLQQYAAELAIEQAARKLVVSAETDRLLVQSFAQRLTGGETKKGQN
jgi:F-type H+-transporting ATPase subunit b